MPDDPRFPYFPTKGKPGLWVLTREQFDVWAATWDTLPLGRIVRQAHAWCVANPQKRKTARGMRKFFVNWFSRELKAQQARRPKHATIFVGSESTHDPYGQFWQCPHTPHCGNRTTCKVVAMRKTS